AYRRDSGLAQPSRSERSPSMDRSGSERPMQVPVAPTRSYGAERESGAIVRALGHFESLLVPGEEIQAYAVQRWLFALTHRRVIVAATTGRFIGMTRNLLGGFHPHDVRWQDLKDVRLYVGTFAADLTIVALSTPDLATESQLRTLRYTGLRKAQAESVYRIAQANEQAWREKCRIRELEELRAKSGGIQLGAAGNPTGQGADPVARLEQAK